MLLKNTIGQYTVVKMLGMGHYARVMKAKSPMQKEPVAIKCLQRDDISLN
jgi:serine/threonine protein kinase